jgi:ABC-type multidrug transport system ATPase subunit
MQNRTVLLVSHHVQLCAGGASYIVALDNGRVTFNGGFAAFQDSGMMGTLVQARQTDEIDDKEETILEMEYQDAEEHEASGSASEESDNSSTVANSVVQMTTKRKQGPAKKLIEEEQRAVGRISREVWATYLAACGSWVYWALFIFAFVVAAISPVLENGWLRYVPVVITVVWTLHLL